MDHAQLIGEQGSITKEVVRVFLLSSATAAANLPVTG
mgnify:CR=1 FL=1